MRGERLEVLILGAGKVGRGLHAALRRARVRCGLRAARAGLPPRAIKASLVVLAVRDRDLPALAAALAERGLVTGRTAVVHVAGALGPEVLAPLRAASAGVAQMHPMISFAGAPPWLSGGHVRVWGDSAATRLARELARKLGMRPRALPGLDTVAYHAAAGLVANGAAALAAAGAGLLEQAGVPPGLTRDLLGPLLHSVASNVEALGLPGALTGPVRRGDAEAVGKHMQVIRRLAPGLVPLYRVLVAAQLPLAVRLGDAPKQAFERVEALLAEGS